MPQLSASDLARELGVSRPRVSQYVQEGKLDGCFNGDGRARRFDLAKVCHALGRRLDPAQGLGNGAATRRAIRALAVQADPVAGENDDADDAPPLAAANHPAGARALHPGDPDGYELARTQLAQEKARQARRDNLLAEGRYVLATEVERQVARTIGREVREVETMLRDAARAVADKLNADGLVVRHVLLSVWRAHRSARAHELAAMADVAGMTEAETLEDV